MLVLNTSNPVNSHTHHNISKTEQTQKVNNNNLRPKNFKEKFKEPGVMLFDLKDIEKAMKE